MTSEDRSKLRDWYRRNRARTRMLFDLIDERAYFERPISLRNPIVFYEGHLAAFTANIFLKRGLRQSAVNEEFEILFERGIDPESEGDVPNASRWPSREKILDYAAIVDSRIEHAIVNAEIDVAGDPMLDGAAALYTILEHEPMHQETLLYIFHRLPHELKKKPAGIVLPPPAPKITKGEMITIYPGLATLGTPRDRFGWDNEFSEHRVEVEEFEIDEYPVTNEEFLEFVDAGGYEEQRYWKEHWEWLQRERITHPLFWEKPGNSWQWRGMFENIPLPPDAPVYVTLAEAAAYARWKWKRLPSEAEFHRAAYGTPEGTERAYPWGDEVTKADGNFDLQHFDPIPVGSYPRSTSAWGVHDLVGNGWEWTTTPFAPFDGFKPMATYPEYSADFFDEKHFVLKGASPATAIELVRRSFRNWFRPTYPYVYAKFRCVSD